MHRWSRFACLAALTMLTAARPALADDAKPVNVLDQPMDTLEAWFTLDGSKPSPASPEDLGDTVPVMRLNNGLVSAKLDRPIPAGVSWVLSFKVLPTHFQRGGWVALLDAAREHGLALRVDSAAAGYFNGTGTVNIVRIDRDQPVSTWKQGRQLKGDLLRRQPATGHNPRGGGADDGALTPPMMAMTLTFDARSGLASVACDGNQLASTPVKPLGGGVTLAQVVMAGNTSMYFDDVKVAAALPAAPPAATPRAAVELNVRDFGAIGDGEHDDAPAFRAALARLAAAPGPKVLDVPKGSYKLMPTDDQGAHLTIAQVQDLTVRGEPGTLLLMGSAFHDGLAVRGCRNVTLRSLAVDYQPLPFTQGRIVSADPATHSFVVALDDGFPRVTDAQMVGKGTRYIAYLYRRHTSLKLNGFYDQYVEKIEPMGDGSEVRITSRNPVEPAFVGNTAAMVARRRADAIVFDSSQHCTGKGLTVYAAPAVAYMLRNDDFITLDGCRIEPRPGTGRAMSTNADGIHVKWGTHGPTIENCWLQGMGDDSVNVGGTYQKIHAVPDGHTLIVDTHGSLRPGPHIMLVHHDTGDMQALGPCTKVEGVKWDGKPAMKLTFTNALPKIDHTLANTAKPTLADMVINFDEVAANPVIRNNFFGRHRERGVLMQAPGAIIEGNRFEDLLGPAIKLGHHYNGRIEGPDGSGAVIRGNTFIHVSRSNIMLSDAGLTGTPGVTQRSIANVKILDNRFTLFGQPSAYGGGVVGNVITLDNAHGVLLAGNVIDQAYPGAPDVPRVIVNQAADVTIRDTIVDGQPAPASQWLQLTDRADKSTIHVEGQQAKPAK